MTKKELIKKFATKNGCENSVANAHVESILEIIKEELKEDESIKIAGFGTFSIKKMAERQGVNPKTLEKITIPEKRKVVFKPFFDI